MPLQCQNLTQVLKTIRTAELRLPHILQNVGHHQFCSTYAIKWALYMPRISLYWQYKFLGPISEWPHWKEWLFWFGKLKLWLTDWLQPSRTKNSIGFAQNINKKSLERMLWSWSPGNALADTSRALFHPLPAFLNVNFCNGLGFKAPKRPKRNQKTEQLRTF